MGLLADLVAAFRQTFLTWRLWLVLWLANLVAGAIAAAPFFGAAAKGLGYSMLSRNQPLLSPYLLLAFQRVVGSQGALLVGPILLSFGLTLTLQPFLAGGTLATLLSRERFRLSRYLSECAALWGKNLGLLLLSLPVGLFVIGLLAGTTLLFRATHRPTLFTLPLEAWADGEVFTPWTLAHALIGLWLLGFGRTYLDVARGLLAQRQIARTRTVAWRAFRLTLSSPALLLAYLLLGTLGTALVLGAMRLHAWLSLGMVLGQVVLIVRMAGSLLPTALIASRLGRLMRVPEPSGSSSGGAFRSPTPPRRDANGHRCQESLSSAQIGAWSEACCPFRSSRSMSAATQR
jgi:hypothetical protein